MENDLLRVRSGNFGAGILRARTWSDSDPVGTGRKQEEMNKQSERGLKLPDQIWEHKNMMVSDRTV